MFLSVVTPPEVAPVTLEEVKAHSVIEHDLDDALLNTFIGAAWTHGENETGRGFVEAEYVLSLDGFPGNVAHGWGKPVELLKPPINLVTSVVYTDREGTEKTLVADYRLHRCYRRSNFSLLPQTPPVAHRCGPVGRGRADYLHGGLSRG